MGTTNPWGGLQALAQSPASGILPQSVNEGPGASGMSPGRISHSNGLKFWGEQELEDVKGLLAELFRFVKMGV